MDLVCACISDQCIRHEGNLPHNLTAKYALCEEFLGSCAFGTVVVCTERASGARYALKVVAKPGILAENEKAAAAERVRLVHEKEVLLLNLSHPNM